LSAAPVARGVESACKFFCVEKSLQCGVSTNRNSSAPRSLSDARMRSSSHQLALQLHQCCSIMELFPSA
jgi:hypothetical protein